MSTRRIRPLLLTGILVAGFAAPAVADVIDGTRDADVLRGTSRADTLRGHAGNDILDGGAGADTLYGGPDDDTLYGRKGADTLRGREGADRLFPGYDSRPDVVRGGPGPDRLYVRVGPTGRGRDEAYAGEGNDRVTVVDVYGWLMPLVNCGPGKDTLVLPYGVGMGGPGCERVVSAPSPYD